MRNQIFTTVSAVVASAAMMMASGCASGEHAPGHGAHGSHGPITKAEVTAAQREWGDGIVDISRVYAETGDAKARATEHINSMYAYGNTIVLFKPTLASAVPRSAERRCGGVRVDGAARGAVGAAAGGGAR